MAIPLPIYRNHGINGKLPYPTWYERTIAFYVTTYITFITNAISFKFRTDYSLYFCSSIEDSVLFRIVVRFKTHPVVNYRGDALRLWVFVKYVIIKAEIS